MIVRFGALGDMVILTPLIRHLYARFGTAVDIVSSGGWTRPLLEGQLGVGKLYLVGSRRWPYLFSREQQTLVEQLRARGPSATWLADYDNTKTWSLLKRAGWRKEHVCDTHNMPDLPGRHMSDLYLRFAYRNPAILGGNDLPLVATDSYGELQLTEAQSADLGAWLRSREWVGKRLLLVQPGNKRTMRRGARDRASNSKYWPESNWAAVVRGLRERYPDHPILMLGVPAEADLNDEIMRSAHATNVHNVARELPIPRLIALCASAHAMVSVDTGPAHVAAAVGCPVVTLFGKQPPHQYAPRGPNARVACVTGEYEGEQSMLGITPEQVLKAWDELRI